MSKKVVGLAICAVFLALSVPVRAQQTKKVPRIGILPPGPISERVHLWEAFRQGLRELGYVEGQNITLVFPSAEVTPERLPHLAAELVSLKVDVIVAAATVAVQAAKEATKTIPIVTPITTDPVETWLVASLARPGGNITGLSYMSSDLSGKRVDLLKEVVPQGFPHCCPVKSEQRKCPAPDERDRGGRPVVGGATSASGSAWPRRLREGIPSCNKGAGRRSHYTGRCFRLYSPHADCEARGKKPAAGDLRIQRVCGSWRPYVLCGEPFRHVPARCDLRGQNPQRYKASRPTSASSRQSSSSSSISKPRSRSA